MISFEPESPEIDENRLGRLGELANKQVALEKLVLEAEEELKELNKQLAKVSERDIPELMAEIGISEITTSEGHKISVKEIMTASISKERRPTAVKWLVEHDLESLISADVVASFGKGDRNAIELAKELVDRGYITNYEEKVNTSSVKAAIKDLLSAGEDVPFELFGVNIVKKSIVR